jgi:hypothetical protein
MPADLNGNWHSRILVCVASVSVYVAFVPAVPDYYGIPIAGPVHLEMAQCSFLIDLHAVGFYSDLYIGTACPGFKLLFSVAISHDHEIQGL